ncbi:hypothetical protein TRAPUB_235 [Trametes pubescens]|uniref:Uncharacterized protein n=1 Tax=Trametes pubescens TaxID=154538 RepID=A0A1M2VMQ6_TRAPU|nr:hypothetical protein TRAPUB_235 [Trametes pubescens]
MHVNAAKMQDDRPVSPNLNGADHGERPRLPPLHVLAAGPGTDAAIHAKFGEASVARSEIHLRAHSILHGMRTLRSSVRGGVTRTTCTPAPPQTPHPYAVTRARLRESHLHPRARARHQQPHGQVPAVGLARRVAVI